MAVMVIGNIQTATAHGQRIAARDRRAHLSSHTRLTPPSTSSLSSPFSRSSSQPCFFLSSNSPFSGERRDIARPRHPFCGLPPALQADHGPTAGLHELPPVLSHQPLSRQAKPTLHSLRSLPRRSAGFSPVGRYTSSRLCKQQHPRTECSGPAAATVESQQ